MSTLKNLLHVFILFALLLACDTERPEDTSFYMIIDQKIRLKDHPTAHYHVIVLEGDTTTLLSQLDPEGWWFTDFSDKYEVGDTLKMKE